MSVSSLSKLKSTIRKNANKENAKNLKWFFKTGKGEYGEGDKFLGLRVPLQRKIAKEFRDLELSGLQQLLQSKFHEDRLISILILVDKYQKAEEKEREKFYKFYLQNRKHFNNWDLVDLSAPKIVGQKLLNRNKDILYKYARSNNLWEKRIAILSTATFIKNKHFKTTFELSDILLNDKHDLIHKAVGWMLREIGKMDKEILEAYLKLQYNKMPRTMLRYAIEKFPEQKRKKYLQGKI